MHTYNTESRFGGNNGTWNPFHPLVLEIEPIPGTTVLPSGTIKFLPSGTVRDGQIQFSADGKSFTGWITTGNAGAVDYRGSLFGVGAIVGVGTDQNLWLRTTLNESWKQVPNSGSVTAVAVATSGQVFGIGTDQRLYSRATLNRPWSGPIGLGSFLAITAMGEGLLGVGTDKFLYTIDMAGNSSKVENSGSVTGVAVARSGEIFGIGTDQRLYKRATLNSPAWSGPIGLGSFLAITAMGEGLLGVGTDKFLYTIDAAGNSSKVQDSGSVNAVSCYPYA
jgi:hypothetical protein